jgi:hypothetical protein
MNNEDLRDIERTILDRKAEAEQGEETPAATFDAPVVQRESQTNIALSTDVGGAISGAKQKIIQKATEKINDEKIIEKHSDNIAKISDRALEVEAEKQRLLVEQVNADNKVKSQEIKNRLIVLKAEAKRHKAEQKQLAKDQKAEHKARNKQAKWDLYGDKLTKMKYTYVPNAFVLSMLLFFDGIVGFINGLGATSTAIVKALKWVLLTGAVIGVLLAIPATREWLLSLLQFI